MTTVRVDRWDPGPDGVFMTTDDEPGKTVFLGQRQASRALAEASRDLGMDVTFPRYMPPGFGLQGIYTHIGPFDPDGKRLGLHHVELFFASGEAGAQIRVDEHVGPVFHVGDGQVLDPGIAGILEAEVSQQPGILIVSGHTADRGFYVEMARRDGLPDTAAARDEAVRIMASLLP